MNGIQAVIWDFGGVLTSSPFDAFNRYEAEHGLPEDFIRSINATNPESNAWARFESSTVACITNNMKTGLGPSMAGTFTRREETERVMALFDLIVESSVEGIRKPDPRIYELTCSRLRVPPDACVFLDDLGINLKPARALGMHTIKVLSEDQAIAELQAVTGLSLG